MAAAYTPASNQTAMHGQLASVQQQLRSAVANLGTVRDIMAQMIASGNDYTLLESQFGYTAGQGTFVFSQVDGLNTALNTDASQTVVLTKIKQFLNQVG